MVWQDVMIKGAAVGTERRCDLGAARMHVMRSDTELERSYSVD